jgi:hypothetical protein
VDEAPTVAGRDGLRPRTIPVATHEELPGALAELALHSGRPVMVLVGSADELDETHLAGLRPLFEEGLTPLVDALGAIVVDGGTNAGVMALIGQARAKLGATFPLIGVAASSTVDTTSASASRDTTALEPNHTHAVLVPGSTRGEEPPWLAAVAAKLAADAPSVTVIINGGEATFDNAARSIESNRTVIVVAGTGRAADTLAAGLLDETSDRRVTALAGSGLLQAVNLADGPHAIARAVAAVLATAPTARPASRSYQAWLQADFHGLFGDLHLSRLRRRFLESRWLDQVLWLEGRATFNRNRYYFWRLLTILGAVLVPPLITLNLNGSARARLSWATFAVSLLVAISAVVEAIYRYGERWRVYRNTAEQLKTEAWQFFQLSGQYGRYDTHNAAYPVFAARIENHLQQF